jgi:hypothetical protein
MIINKLSISSSHTPPTLHLQMASIGTKPCKFFLQGKCHNGANCKFSHSTASTVTRTSAPAPKAPQYEDKTEVLLLLVPEELRNSFLTLLREHNQHWFKRGEKSLEKRLKYQADKIASGSASHSERATSEVGSTEIPPTE